MDRGAPAHSPANTLGHRRARRARQNSQAKRSPSHMLGPHRAGLARRNYFLSGINIRQAFTQPKVLHSILAEASHVGLYLQQAST